MRRLFLMTHLTKTLTSLALSALAFSAVSASAMSAFTQAQRATLGNNSKLVVNLKGVNLDKGHVMVALFDCEESFDNNAPIENIVRPANSAQIKAVFDEIPVGNYAFKLYHDVDGDGALGREDKILTMASQNWDEAEFLIPAGMMIKTVRLDD